MLVDVRDFYPLFCRKAGVSIADGDSPDSSGAFDSYIRLVHSFWQ